MPQDKPEGCEKKKTERFQAACGGFYSNANDLLPALPFPERHDGMLGRAARSRRLVATPAKPAEKAAPDTPLRHIPLVKGGSATRGAPLLSRMDQTGSWRIEATAVITPRISARPRKRPIAG